MKNIIISLPPESTHTLQRFGKTFMGALKRHYGEKIRQFMLHFERMLKTFMGALKCHYGEEIPNFLQHFERMLEPYGISVFSAEQILIAPLGTLQ